MAYEPKPGSFSLFKNAKDGVETRPDYTGTGMDLEGNPIRVSAWLKEGKSGKFMSCRIEPQKSASVLAQKQSISAKPAQASAFDDELPPF